MWLASSWPPERIRLPRASFAASQMSQALDAGPGHDAVLARFASGLSSRDVGLLRRLLADGAGRADGAGPVGDQG